MRVRLERSVSLAMIVRNDAAGLKRCLKSVKPHVDEIVIVDTGSDDDATLNVAHKWADKVIERPDLYDEKLGCVRSFSEARQISFDNCLGDYIIWLDSDDVLVGGEHLANAAEQLWLSRSSSGLWMVYRYAQNEDGEWTVAHYKRRLVERRAWKWEFKIHENLRPLTQRECSYNPNLPICVEHHSEHDPLFRRDRNLKMLMAEYEERPSDYRERVASFIGRTHMAYGETLKAIEWLESALIWMAGDDKYFHACVDLGACYLNLDPPRAWKASEYYWTAHRIWPGDPRPWIGLARCAMARKQWERALEYTKHALGKEVTPSCVPYSPFELKWGLFSIRHQALFNLKRMREAMEELEEVARKYPENKVLTELREKHILREEQENANSAIISVSRSIPEEKQREFFSLLPEAAQKSESVLRQKAILLGNKSRDKELVFFCGETGDKEWRQDVLDRGMGGSETMVVRMVERMAKLGYKVRVYGGTQKQFIGEHAIWYPSKWFPDRKKFGTVVIWRNPSWLSYPWSADRTLLWFHDAMLPEHMSPLATDRADRILFLSQWHRSLLPDVPDEKVIITRNGIDVAMHAKAQAAAGPRKRGQCLSCSSPDRSLWILLRIWPKVKELVPHATLKVAYGFGYGWNRSEQITKRNIPGGPGIDFGEFRHEVMNQMAADPSIEFLGMIPEFELLKHFYESHVWAYPTKFGETSCISAMHAQVSGAIPVTSAVAALKETVFVPDARMLEPIHDVWTEEEEDAYLDMLVETLLDDKYADGLCKDSREEALHHFDLKPLAKQWDQIIQGIPPNQPLRRVSSEYWDEERRKELYHKITGAGNFHSPRMEWLEHRTKGKNFVIVLGCEAEPRSVAAKKMVGINLSRQALSVSMTVEKENKSKPDCTYIMDAVEDYLRKYPDPGNGVISPDMVVFFETIEHLHNPEEMLDHIKRIGTRELLVTTPNFYGAYGMRSAVGSVLDGHITLWTPEQFKILLERYGKIEEFFEMGEILHARVTMGA